MISTRISLQKKRLLPKNLLPKNLLPKNLLPKNLLLKNLLSRSLKKKLLSLRPRLMLLPFLNPRPKRLPLSKKKLLLSGRRFLSQKLLLLSRKK